MTIQLAYKQLLAQLYEVYASREAETVANMVIEKVTGQDRLNRIMYKDLPVSSSQQEQLLTFTGQLLRHKPVQYVLGEAWFFDFPLRVNEAVLIPRPETEELVQWIINDSQASKKDPSVLDVGTGSGCIPIALKKKLPAAQVSAIDVSPEALQVATLNSIDQHTLVDFLQVDFLNEEEWQHLGRYDIVVSNPPYIKSSERSTMQKNVLEYEPSLALFVADDDSLVFYRQLAKFGKVHLKTGGCIYAEINEALASGVIELFSNFGYTEVMLKKDMQGKDRMVKAGGL